MTITRHITLLTLTAIVLAVAVFVVFLPRAVHAAPTVSQVDKGTTTGDQTINVPAALSGVTIVYVSIINDGDGAHTAIDGTFTFGGLAMTEAIGGQVNQGNYHVSIYYLKNFTSSGNQTMHYGNHGGFGTMQWAVYTLSNTDTSAPLDGATSGSNAGSANPSLSITTGSDSSILIDGVGDANSLTDASSQTVDQSSDTNLAVAHKTGGTAGSQTVTWTASSGSWAMGLIGIKGSGGGAVAQSATQMMLGDSF